MRSDLYKHIYYYRYYHSSPTVVLALRCLTTQLCLWTERHLNHYVWCLRYFTPHTHIHTLLGTCIQTVEPRASCKRNLQFWCFVLSFFAFFSFSCSLRLGAAKINIIVRETVSMLCNGLSSFAVATMKVYFALCFCYL